MSPPLTPLARAEQALEAASHDLDQARGRCLEAWQAWLDTTEDRRRAMKAYANAERDLAVEKAKEDAP